MHRRSGADLLPLDAELEKEIRNIKKERKRNLRSSNGRTLRR